MTTNTLKSIWPEWEMEEKPLGKGSFGVVYKAVRNDHNVKSYAAIKVISIPTDPSEIDSLRSEGLDEGATKTYLQGIVDEFVAEIQMMESLKGIQNIVSVEDYKVVERTNEIGWDIYIRMELLTPFNNHICDKKLTEEEVIKLGCDICTALEICGKRNIIHRDIKPENIFVNDFGFFKLGDFGIARKMENMTGGLSQKGTFNYMAPEVATSNEYDARVDTYSLGIVLYRLLNSNRLPFLDTEKQILNPNERKNAVDRRIRGEELPAPCEASAAMADVILRACAFDPNKRFASATEMKQALESVANGTYKAAAPAGDMDATVSVRKAAEDCDKTVSVRKAPANKKPTIADQKVAVPGQAPKQQANTFGSKPKKKIAPKIIAAVIAAVLLIIGVLVLVKVVLPQQEINEILADAKALASKGNYLDAAEEIKCGLEEYPDSDKLRRKLKEYQQAHIDQQIASVLGEADALAALGKFEEAIGVLNNGLADYPDSQTLREKLDQYTAEYDNQQITTILADAEAFAQMEQYKLALDKVNAGLTKYPNSQALKDKAAEYLRECEEREIAAIIAEAEELAAAGDYAGAISSVDAGLEDYPDSQTLKDKLTAYTAAYDDQQLAQIISEAEALAAAEDYRAALSKVNSGLTRYPDSADLKQMSQNLSAALDAQIKEEVLAEAEGFAACGDYLSAMAVIEEAMKNAPNDADYAAAYEEYKEASTSKKVLNIAATKDNTITVAGVFVGETKTISEEAVVTYNASITGEDEVDEYTFVAPRGGVYGFEIANLSANNGVHTVVFDSTGKEILGMWGKFEDVSLTGGETYKIYVHQDDGYPTYTLNIYSQKPTVDLSTTTTVYDQTAFSGQVNKYTFTAPVAGKYHFELSEYKNGVGFYMLMWDKLDNRVMESGSEKDSVYLNAGETYDFQIEQDTDTGSYKLSIGFQKETVDLTGVTVAYDSTEYENQQNDYTFTAPVTGKYHFELSEYKNGVGFYMLMWDKYDNCIMESGSEKGSVFLDAGETYRFRIEQDTGTGSYKLSIGYQKKTEDITGYEIINDSMAFDDQRNVYLFTPSATGSYTFSLTNFNANCTFTMKAWDDYDYNIMDTGSTSYTLFLDGGVTYTIHIYKGKGTGSYSLHISRETTDQ